MPLSYPKEYTAHKTQQRMFNDMSQAMSENGVLQERVKDLEHLRDNFATQNRRLCEDLNALKDKLVSLI